MNLKMQQQLPLDVWARHEQETSDPRGLTGCHIEVLIHRCNSQENE